MVVYRGSGGDFRYKGAAAIRRAVFNALKKTLERLTDIRDELGRQLGRLERQAKARRKVRGYKQQERQLTAELLGFARRKYNQSGLEQKQVIGDLEIEQEKLNTQRSACDTEIEKLRVEFSQSSDAFNEIQANYYKIGGEVFALSKPLNTHNSGRKS